MRKAILWLCACLFCEGVVVRMVGDMMLGRGVNQRLVEQPDYNIWGTTLSVLKEADLLLGNLESTISCACTLTAYKCQPWPGKMYHVAFEKWIVNSSLKAVPFHHVNLANNHILDFGLEGLRQSLETLAINNISWAGAGIDLQSSIRPAVKEVKGIRFHIFGASEQEREWAAGLPYVKELRQVKGEEGTWVFDLSKPEVLVNTMEHYRRKIGEHDVIILYLHWGENWERTLPKEKKDLARALLLHAGVNVIVGTSPHHIQPWERIGNGVVFYSIGDFVNDYPRRAEWRNDLAVIPSINFHTSGSIKEVQFIPVVIKKHQVNLWKQGDPADEEFFRWKGIPV